jgi:integrase
MCSSRLNGTTPSRRSASKAGEGRWTIRDGLYPLNNFTPQFNLILKQARVDRGQFHDLRRTCISNWLKNGLREYEAMKLAGHANFATTHKFYLAVSQRLVSRARDASKQALGTDFVAHLLRAPSKAHNEKRLANMST